MITARLSQHQDLLEDLDPEGIWDFLEHNGVLDDTVFSGLDKRATNRQRNSAIFKHIEEQGNMAVTLLVNALRQSWQLPLASCLDTEQRIRPASCNSYLGNERHRGQITILIEAETLKLLDSGNSQSVNKIEAFQLGSPVQYTNETLAGTDVRDVTDRILVSDIPCEVPVSNVSCEVPVSEVSCALDRDDDDDVEFVKPRSCWCFCLFSQRKCKSKKDIQKYNKKSQIDRPEQLREPMLTQKFNNNNDKQYKKSVQYKREKVKNSKKLKFFGKYSVPNKRDVPVILQLTGNEISGENVAETDVTSSKDVAESEITYVKEVFRSEMTSGKDVDITSVQLESGDARAGDVLPTSSMGLSMLEHISHSHPYNPVVDTSTITRVQRQDMDSRHSPVLEYNPKLELLKIGGNQADMTLSSRHSPIPEPWLSEGKCFQEKASQLCEMIVHDLKTAIEKYVEQERGMLVLDVVSSGCTVMVKTICMTLTHVQHLQQDIHNGSLLAEIKNMLSQVDTTKMGIQDVQLRISLLDQEVKTVITELS